MLWFQIFCGRPIFGKESNVVEVDVEVELEIEDETISNFCGHKE
jgi:hypothetical protein